MKNDRWETKNVIGDSRYKEEILKHYQYLAQHLCRIAHKREGTFVAAQDAWYRAGQDTVWEDCVPDEIKNQKFL